VKYIKEVDIRQRLADSNSLLKSSIVEVSAGVKSVLGSLNGLRVSLNAILEGLFHLPCTTIAVFRKGVKRAFIPALKSEVFSPAFL
jgi:hypothetical protein